MPTENELSNMNNEQLTIYITELLDASEVNYFYYDRINEKSKIITNTHFKSDNGWEVIKEDKWND